MDGKFLKRIPMNEENLMNFEIFDWYLSRKSLPQLNYGSKNHNNQISIFPGFGGRLGS